MEMVETQSAIAAMTVFPPGDTERDCCGTLIIWLTQWQKVAGIEAFQTLLQIHRTVSRHFSQKTRHNILGLALFVQLFVLIADSARPAFCVVRSGKHKFSELGIIRVYITEKGTIDWNEMIIPMQNLNLYWYFFLHFHRVHQSKKNSKAVHPNERGCKTAHMHEIGLTLISWTGEICKLLT